MEELLRRHSVQALPKGLLSDLGAGPGIVRISGLRPGALALFLYTLYHESQRPLWVFTRSSTESRRLCQDLSIFIRHGKDAPAVVEGSPSREHIPLCSGPVYLPPPGYGPYEYLTIRDPESQARVVAAYRLSTEPQPLVVSSCENLAHRQLPRQALLGEVLNLEEGARFSREKLLSRLVAMGYRTMTQVQAPGEFSARGGIIDIFSPGFVLAARIELNGDEIASLRAVNVATYRTAYHVRRFACLPVAELTWNETSQQLLLEILVAEAERRSFSPLRSQQITAALEEGREELVDRYVYPHLGAQLPWSEWATPESIVVLLEDEEQTVLRDHFGKKAVEEFDRISATYLLPPPDRLYLSRQEVQQSLARFPVIAHRFFDSYHENQSRYVFNTKQNRSFGGDLMAMTRHLEQLTADGDLVLVAAQNRPTLDRIRQSVTDYHTAAVADKIIPAYTGTGHLEYVLGDLSEGFAWQEAGLVFITEKEILGQKLHLRHERKTDVDLLGMSFKDLEAGDYVVHVDHGIGKYLGVKRIVVEDAPRDFAELLYADENRLFLPMDKLHLIQKYSGGGDHHPALDKLGGTRWLATKSKVKEAVLLLAAELLKLYARREVTDGFGYSADTSEQRMFELNFPFEETPDQIKAIREVKRDMERPKAMDRLICGDVGYGKTEVAMRAAFKAVMDSRQVAILTPTTVLCQQHYDNFKQRFSNFPMTIGMLSRFVDSASQKKELERLKQGQVDIVIGTHRLLSADVVFKQLGLLVIDEEHRFGVRHKERIKEMRAAVDVLTLTATPIPRTLHMSLSGIRDMSVIHTPPEERLPIRTRIMTFSADVIRQAIRAELGRGGQVYFVHNRVQSIESMAHLISKLAPEARLIIGHGQMKESQLAAVMRRFAAHEFDILVSTTIIESGLDIPAVNTIIINRADRFGLAQLYQLRGRVGRDRYQAYAYLFVPGFNLITREARQRLEAIAEAKELGAGFKLAMADLEIRGAGDLLGARQHGHIAAIGFELYCSMLREAVNELRGEKPEDHYEPTVNLPGAAYIPDNYLPESGQRLYYYRNLSAARTADILADIAHELEDCYGALPEEVKNLLVLLEIKQIARLLRLRKIDHGRSKITLWFDSDSPADPGAREVMVETYAAIMKELDQDRLEIAITGMEPTATCSWLKTILTQLLP